MQKIFKIPLFIFIFFTVLYGSKSFNITDFSVNQNSKNVSKYKPITIKFNQNIDEISLIGNIIFTNTSNNKNIDFSRKVKDKNTLIIQAKKPLLNKNPYTLLFKKQIKSSVGLSLEKPHKLSFQTGYSIGTVSRQKGEATIKRGKTDIISKPKTSLQNQDTIKTQKKTKLQLAFDDDTLITLGSKTLFKITGYQNKKGVKKASFDVQRGYFKAITGKIGKLAPKNFTIQTKTSLIGIRGTVFEGRVGTQKGGDFISCLDGQISVTSRKTHKTVILKKQQGVHVSVNGRIGKVETVRSNKYKN